MSLCTVPFLFFFFNNTATTEIYTLSLHDALPISATPYHRVFAWAQGRDAIFIKLRPEWYKEALADGGRLDASYPAGWVDRKSTRLNSSHQIISYAVFCLKKKRE